MAKLIVRRDFKNDAGFRPVHVFLDEEHIATLEFDQFVERDIAPGNHKLRVYNTLVSKTVDFEAADEAVRFTTGNQASGCLLAIFVSFGIPVMHVILERVQES